MKKSPYFFLALIAVFVFACVTAHANPFMSGRPSEISASFLDSFSTPFVQQILDVQRQIHQAITDRIETLKEGKSLAALWSLLMISFAYGVFHVLAPGHGKVVVGSYFLGNDARWRDGIWAGLVMAVGHTITAVGIVAVLYLALGLGQFKVLSDARYAELAGYGLIAAIGLWLLFRAIRNDPRCGSCGHHHHGHHHKHDHNHDHVHTHDESLTEDKPGMGLFAAASLVPCTGSMIILLFTLANDVLWAGVLAVIAIALGMWLTVTAIGLISIFLRRVVEGDDMEHRSGWRNALTRTVSILAALFVTATGGLLFAGTLYSMMG
jgi:ABC-type nickel/cobalt efflux system permease component RcnA